MVYQKPGQFPGGLIVLRTCVSSLYCTYCWTVYIPEPPWIIPLQGFCSLSGWASYRKISWRLEAARLGIIIIVSLWNLTGISAVLLPRCLSNFKAIGQSKLESRGFEISRDLTVKHPSSWWVEALNHNGMYGMSLTCNRNSWDCIYGNWKHITNMILTGLKHKLINVCSYNCII